MVKAYSLWKGSCQSRSGVARKSKRTLERHADDTCSENAPGSVFTPASPVVL